MISNQATAARVRGPTMPSTGPGRKPSRCSLRWTPRIAAGGRSASGTGAPVPVNAAARCSQPVAP